MKNANKQALYTEGPIGSRMIKTTFAMLAGTLAMSGYNIVDTFFVGKLGTEPLAAMGFTFPVIMLIGCVFHGLATGVMTTSAQAIGGDRHFKASKLVSNGVRLVFLFSCALAVLGYCTADPLFEAFGAAGRTLEEVKGYMNIWYLGCATSSLCMLGNNILVGIGDSKNASRLMMMGLLINAAIDPLFIFGWGIFPAMGIKGAALATVIAQSCAMCVMCHLLHNKHKLLTFEKMPWKEMKASWGLTFKFAIPASIGMMMMPIGSSIITWITAKFGDAAVAATAASGRLEMIAFVFPMALGITLTPMVGQNFGAKKYSRIRTCLKFATAYAFTFLMLMAVIYFFFADKMVVWFSPVPEVQEIMARCLRITAWGFAMIEIHRYSGFFFIGCGRPSAAAWLNGFRILVLMIPFSLLAMYLGSLTGLFYARLAADLIAGSTGLFLAWRMTRKLPADGELVTLAGGSIFRKVFQLRNLPAFGTAQAKIDSSSGTQ